MVAESMQNVHRRTLRQVLADTVLVIARVKKRRAKYDEMVLEVPIATHIPHRLHFALLESPVLDQLLHFIPRHQLDELRKGGQ